ncbi:2OG-Fe(II) oxygenase [Phenylobacterium sp.]|uniref:2OG-Fe(II) oxygenase family protein n=1 Tax=Phenylobacterium sp. TaxID=1871053 RepID=UPI0025D2E232|nr:2OG-Fe(II) oxygenase [Phenylobacterium sp.]MBX3485165.1 2OG-Fe(II) oxygenase [Phenylobacterium sp.]MCW5761143.1 2OG-Fe(II) oxygenase [Phenylobacterium sp.]
MSLHAGAPAPLFSAPSHVNPEFAFGSLGGRWILLAFLPPPGPERDAAIDLVRRNAQQFPVDQRIFFGVLPDAESFHAHAADQPPMRWFDDSEGRVRRLFGAEGPDGQVTPEWVIVDPSLRIMGCAPLDRGPQVLASLFRLGPPDGHAGVPLNAPVLIVPRLFEPPFCRELIDIYDAQGGLPSGTMREKDGKTVGVLSDFKKRRDAILSDPQVQGQIRARVSQRLLPEIEKAYHFKVTRIERYIVACYDAEEGGYFQPHRDNTTAGTAHRQFAVSINLNDDFDGGDLRFPEFGSRTYRPPVGGAVVFSCSLLHEATNVTRGRRYACLPFLYNEAAAEIRRQNMHTLEVAEA